MQYVDDEFKKLALSDETILNAIRIYLFYNFNKSESKDDTLKNADINTYDFYNWYLNEKEDNNTFKKDLTDIAHKVFNDKVLNESFKLYSDIHLNESKEVIVAISRLLYMQDKYKDDEIGQVIDDKIKLMIKCLKEATDEYINSDYVKNRKDLNLEQQQDVINHLWASNFNYAITSVNYNVFSYKNRRPFTNYWIYDIDKVKLKEFLHYGIENNINEAKHFKESYNEKIHGFINDTISNKQFSDFLKANNDKISELRDKCLNDEEKEKYKNLFSVKAKYLSSNEIDEKLEKILNEPFLNATFELYQEYQSQQAYINLEQTETDIKAWRNKADLFIKHLEESTKGDYNTFTFDYMLEHLAYNDYQKKTYKTGIKSDLVKPKKAKKLSNKALKEKYKDKVLLNDEDLDYNRKWAKIDTSKVNTNIMTIRETIGKKVDSNTDITERKIKEIEKKAKKSKADLVKLDDLKERLKEQQQEKEALLYEINDLKADIDLINKQIGDTEDARQLKKLTRERKKREESLREKEEILNNRGVYFQINTEGKLVHEKKISKTESYKLMVNADYDIQNFNQEGRNFLYYIPNIPNVINQLDDDFITIDIDDFLDFTGRPTGNVSRIRRNLQSTLKEMRKESYDYTYKDDKGVLHDDSLVLIGDIKSTEYKGKATIKVQLGATFKSNLKEAFIKNQIANVNKDVFKLGQGKNNKTEKMAKEIFLYLSKLARIEAKKGTDNGKWQKDLHLDVLITHLAELNLINYNPNDYNKSVKEPLLNALNVGMENGLFTYKTNAFKYYDDVIASGNNGANVKDKITNFENGKKYGVRITINKDMIDIESNEKAHKTYLANQRKYNRKATKK